MIGNRRLAVVLVFDVILAVSCASLAAQTSVTVIPAAYATVDANSHVGVAGATHEGRQQTLIGSSHLAALLGRDLTAVELRRSAADETFQGGSVDLTVRLSTSPNAPLTASRAFAANEGPDAVLVFQGAVSLPNSPPALGPTVAWTAANTVRIAFQQPFRYVGGTLCLDVTGTPTGGVPAGWWVADAVFEDIAGSVVEIGGGCGGYGGAAGRWSHVAERSLLAGGHARLWAYGQPNALAFAVFGSAAAQPIPLRAFGPGSAGCNVHLQPAALAGSMVAVFAPQPHPILASRGGVAEIHLRLPNEQWLLGARVTTQLLDLGRLATSNALQWTVAAQLPALDMALLDGHPLDATGEVSVHLAHVLRFEHRAP